MIAVSEVCKDVSRGQDERGEWESSRRAVNTRIILTNRMNSQMLNMGANRFNCHEMSSSQISSQGRREVELAVRN
jgi:hypothetical protein